MSNSDAELVARAQAGNLDAFDELVSIHQSRVYALARRILGNDDDAADAAQETFVRAWRSLRKFRRDSELATWLHRITVNLCISRKRRREPVLVPFDEDIALLRREAPAEPGPVQCLERAETALMLRQVIAAIPAHYRVLLVLREIEDRPFEEIARILGCSEQSARTRAFRARRMLRERMRPYLEDLPSPPGRGAGGPDLPSPPRRGAGGEVE